MAESFTGLELALIKAKKEKKVLIYQDYGNNYDVSSTYDDFYFHKFKNVKDFCTVLYEIISNISENETDYEFPDHFTDDHFYVLIDGWKNLYVTNFPESIDISEHEGEIEEYFENKIDTN